MIFIFSNKENILEYVDWLHNYLLECENFTVRLANPKTFKPNETKEDIENFLHIFPFFSKMLGMSSENGFKRDMFEDEMESEYKDSYMCFDCSVVLRVGSITMALIVLELGGSSDMVIKLLDGYEDENIINI